MYSHVTGAGTPVTLQTANPSQTSANNKGSSQCGSLDDACDRAVAKYEDDRVYDKRTSYTARGEHVANILYWMDAGCTAIFTCKNDDYGFGMTGAQIKEA